MKYLYITSLFCLLYLSAIGQDNIYTYPLRPGMPAWKSLKTAQDRLDACEVPQSYLDKASTTDLLITCLNSPVLFEATASNSFLIGMNSLCLQVKSFQALRQRDDYTATLLAYYRSTNPKSIMYITDDDSKFRYILKYLYSELLLANEKFVQNLNDPERKELIQLLLTKFEEKNQVADSFRYFGTIGSLLGLAQVLKIDYQKNKVDKSAKIDISKIDQILDSHIGINKDISAYVLQESYNFIK